jgi:hypothetical protein
VKHQGAPEPESCPSLPRSEDCRPVQGGRRHLCITYDTAHDSVIDADHRVEEKTRRCSGWFVQLYGCSVAWGLRLKATDVESTCAAEFDAACMGESSAMSFKDLVIGTTGKGVAKFLLVDNQSAVGKLPRPFGGTMWLQLKRGIVRTLH